MAKLTNEIADQRLIDQNCMIKRLDDISGNKTKIFWQCLIVKCQYIWQTTPGHILNSKSGCPKCAGHLPLTNEEVDHKLLSENRNIKRIGNISGNKNNIEWQCLIIGCNHIWKAKPNNVLNAKNGCPKCARNFSLTNEIVDLRLIGRNIKRLDNIISSETKHKWECLIENCSYIWSAMPRSVLGTKNGCSKCNCNFQ